MRASGATGERGASGVGERETTVSKADDTTDAATLEVSDRTGDTERISIGLATGAAGIAAEMGTAAARAAFGATASFAKLATNSS